MIKGAKRLNILGKEFSHISEATLHAGIEHQIKALMNDGQFAALMVTMEEHAWKAFRYMVHNFLRNHKSNYYNVRVKLIILCFRELGCRMSMNTHFLDSHLDYFPSNLGANSEEQGECFHQDISEMECRSQGRWHVSITANYCWSISLHNPETQQKRKSYGKQCHRVR